ncbi:MAG: hypothetical protein ACOX8E_05745 [Ruminococcus sp.]
MKSFDRDSGHVSHRFWKTISLVLVLAMVFTAVTVQWPAAAQAQGSSVYLDGSAGSDAADGASPSSAVQSFGRAKELAGSSGEILVCGTVYVSGDTAWSLPGGVSLKRAPGFSGAIVNISGTLTLNNISLGAGDISGSGSIAGEEKKEPEVTAEPTKEPEATAEPTKEPEATAEPTKEPEATAEPTKEPEATAEPTKEPEATAEPTKEPEATAEPTKEPEVTAEPTKEPEVTAEPTKEPEATAEPTKEPEVTAEPTKEPEATAEPTKEPEATAEPTKEPEATAEPTKEPEATAEPTKEPEKESPYSLLENLKVAVGNDEDVQAVLDAYRWYEGCTEDEKTMVPQELVIRLKKVQSACKIYNHTSNGVTVSGDIPWYVQFRVTEGGQGANFDLGELLGSYEMNLWNLLEDAPYDLNGTAVTVTVPVSNAQAYEKISVIHYLDDGSYEILTPKILDGAIRFTTTSFSPYSIAGSIAGSTVLVGPGDAVYNHQSQGQSSAGSAGTSQTSSSGSASSGSSTSSSSGSSSVVSAQSSGRNSGSTTRSGSSSNSSGSVFRTASSVRTGDSSSIMSYLVVVAVAAVLIVILIVVGRISARKNNKKK